MNDKEILMENGAEQESEARVARHSVSGAIFAALLCILLAGLVWICVMNTQDTDFIPVRVQGPEGYECTLSVDGVEVEGKVADLRHMDEIVVTLGESDMLYVIANFGGSASVNEAFLGLPEEVSVTRTFSAVLTVKAK